MTFCFLFLQLTLSQQVMKFSDNKNKWTAQTRSEAIYLFYIGSDDYLNYAKNNPNPSDDQKEAFVDRVITSVEAELKVKKVLRSYKSFIIFPVCFLMYRLFR